MARAKIKRGSTSVDMTPMCDVAFLLLTFFILAAQFKPTSAVHINPPSSVSQKVAPQKNFLTVSIDKNNKVYLIISQDIKTSVLEELGKERNITFTPEDVKDFDQAGFIGTPISQLIQFDKLTPDQIKGTVLPGIPVDSTNNELTSWISAAVTARMGDELNFLIKGDDDSKYSTFENVIDAFKKNDIYKYKLITNAKAVPEGSELYKKSLEEQREGKKGGE